jgi:hypothetical protein
MPISDPVGVVTRERHFQQIPETISEELQVSRDGNQNLQTHRDRRSQQEAVAISLQSILRPMGNGHGLFSSQKESHSIGFSGGRPLPFGIPLKLCRYYSILGHQLP